MLMEALIFAAFYAVALIALAVHALFSKEHRADAARAHRIAVVVAAAGKAASLALHDYALHVAEAVVHALAH